MGIGTTSPTRALHINSGTANEVARFESTDTEALIELVDTTGSAQIRSRNDLRFYTNGGSTRAMDISSSGNVGIGTASPAAPLHINQESNAISGTNVDVSNLGLKIINPQNDNDEAVGMGFALSTASSNIGAAIIHQRDDVQSRGSLSFATKGVLGEGADIPIRMTIDSNGNVGIGTTSPTQPLNVLVPDNSGIQIESAAGHKGYLFFGDEASNTRGRIGYDHATDAMGLWTASAEAVVINSSGKVGIGTTSPSATLDLVSSGTNSQNLLDLNSASGIRAKVATDAQDDAYMYLYDSADDLKVAFRTDGNDSYIAGGGNVGIGTTSPSSALDVVGDIEVSGNAKIGAAAISQSQTSALLSVRQPGSSIEFGHNNSAGYVSTIGANSNNGKPYIAFSAEQGTNNNTLKTRGLKGTLIEGGTSGEMTFKRVPTASADNQTPVESMRIDSSGNVLVGNDLSASTTTLGVQIELMVYLQQIRVAVLLDILEDQVSGNVEYWYELNKDGTTVWKYWYKW